jgi:cyclophilin family peptidyl-prolyl cis-trans isomerase
MTILCMTSSETKTSLAPFVLLLMLNVGCGGAQKSATSGELATAATTASGDSVDEVNSAEEPLSDEFPITDRVQIKTSLGNIVVGLYGEASPKTVENFLGYVERGFYSGKIFHRIIPGFMIQGGGFDVELKRAPTESPVELELIPGLKHSSGTVSMARTSNPHSATSQFFVCVADAPQLNGGYAAFGRVEEGIEVAQAIARVATETVEADHGSMGDVPIEPVLIEGISKL